MRRVPFVGVLFCLFLSATSLSFAQQGGQTSTLPPTFWGMSFNEFCNISSDSSSPCAGGSFAFPGPAMPVGWGRTLGSGITWNTLVLCDPTGNWCPIAGSGCAANYGTGSTGAQGGNGTWNHYLAADGTMVTCGRPGIYDNGAAAICPNGTGGGSAIWCMPGKTNPVPCIPNMKLPTDPTNCAYAWNWNSSADSYFWYKDQFDEYVGLFNNTNGGIPLMLNLSVIPDYLSIEGSRCTGYHTSINGVAPNFNGVDNSCYAAADNNCSSEPNLGAKLGFSSGSLSIAAAAGGCHQTYDADSAVTPAALGNAGGSQAMLDYFTKAMFAHMYQYYQSSNTSETLWAIEIGNEPNVCTQWAHADGGGGGSSSGPCQTNATATARNLVKMAHTVRVDANSGTYNQTGVTPLIVSPPTVGAGSFSGYLATILNGESELGLSGGANGTTNQFDLIGFHGYYTPANDTTGTQNGWCWNEPASNGSLTTLLNCPKPEAFTQLWQELFFTLSAGSGACSDGTGVCCPDGDLGKFGKGNYQACNPYYTTAGNYLPAIDTEISWNLATNVVNGDQRAAQAARSVILQAQFYPELTAFNWYGEDFGATPPQPLFNNDCLTLNNPNPPCPEGTSPNPGGGTGQLWSQSQVTSSFDSDACTAPATAQGGFMCQAASAAEVVNNWFRQGPLGTEPRRAITATAIGSNQSCTCATSSHNGGGNGCSPTNGLPPEGVWACPLTLSGTPNNCTDLTVGYCGEIVWDNTWDEYPCSALGNKGVCGNTTYTLPAWVHGASGADPQQQLLSGAPPSRIAATTTTVPIGAKPVLIENQRIATTFTPSD